jgi:hypothetical protein
MYSSSHVAVACMVTAQISRSISNDASGELYGYLYEEIIERWRGTLRFHAILCRLHSSIEKQTND